MRPFPGQGSRQSFPSYLQTAYSGEVVHLFRANGGAVEDGVSEGELANEVVAVLDGKLGGRDLDAGGRPIQPVDFSALEASRCAGMGGSIQ